MVVQLKSSGGNQPFSSLQCLTAVPKKESVLLFITQLAECTDVMGQRAHPTTVSFKTYNSTG